MLLEPGHRVLELGTGNGWNAALLAGRTGPGLVASVETDPACWPMGSRPMAMAWVILTRARPATGFVLDRSTGLIAEAPHSPPRTGDEYDAQ